MKTKGLILCGDIVVHPALKDHVGYCFIKAASRLRARIDQAIAEYQIIAPMLGIMRVLNGGGPISQIELGRSVGVDKATMVKFIDHLENLGFVTRTEGSPDRRKKIVSLSKLGASKLNQISKLREQAENDFLAPLTKEEQKTLRTVLPKLLGV